MGKEDYLRVPITMPGEMFAYLEDLSLKCRMSGGRKLPNTAIVRACVNTVAGLDLDVTGVKDEHELEERIKQAWKKALK